MSSYSDFLESKKRSPQFSGFDPYDFESQMFEFQAWIIDRAVKAGKYAIFADCGMGKTIMQLEWGRQVAKHTGKPVLGLAPLAVVPQTIEEASHFGIEAGRIGSGHIEYTNYEQLENIDISRYGGVILDESSILKNFTGKMRTAIIESFRDFNYKLACTATPSPNDPMELGNHSEFLDKMSRNEMLAMFFVHDGGETSKWRLKGHAKKDFYGWVSTWAVMVSNPSDIGFDGSSYALPELEITRCEVKTDKQDNGLLFNDLAVSATDFNKELRRTQKERISKVVDLVNSTDGQVIVWCKQNQESEEIARLIDDAVEVKGSDKPEYKESKLLGFGRGEFRVLVTKTKIAQFGLNYQNCSHQVFTSPDFSFEGTYQAIRRSYRFGQKNKVNVAIVTTDTMGNVVDSFKEKQKKFKEMQQQMQIAMNETYINDAHDNIADGGDYSTDEYRIANGDCVELIQTVESDSVGFSVFSPPFAELYTYSNDHRDMGNSTDYEQFFEQFSFLASELYRVLKPGRNVAIHCMDLPIQKGKEGFIGLRDFSGMIMRLFGDIGFVYHSRVTIWKDPVIEMQRTKALGLLHKQVKKDSTMSRVGIPDYLLIFRKDGEREDPVHCDIDVDTWQKYASPVWMDINYSDTLQHRTARENNDEKHICPLQLQTIERAITLYSNKGDTVLTPFMGIGSEVWQALSMGRKAIGFELKRSYFDLAKQHIESLANQATLF